MQRQPRGILRGNILNRNEGVALLCEAISVYEKARMLCASIKQQGNIALGAVYMFEDGPRQRVRNESFAASVARTDLQESVERLSGDLPTFRSLAFCIGSVVIDGNSSSGGQFIDAGAALSRHLMPKLRAARSLGLGIRLPPVAVGSYTDGCEDTAGHIDF